MLIGRTAERLVLREWLAHRHHTLIVGPIGIGKSALMAAAVEGLRGVIRVPRLQPLKPVLLSIAQQGHAQGRLELPEFDSAYLDWHELQPQISVLSTETLLEQLTPLVSGTLLLVDDLDGLTAATARLLEPWFPQALFVGAITTMDMTSDLQRWFWHFRVLPLEPLDDIAARELLWTQIDRAAVPDSAVFEQHVLERAGGNPLAIRELVCQALRGPLRHPGHIRQLHHDAGLRYLDLTPMLLVLGACAVIARFLALGLNDIEAYILAGGIGALFLVGRHFIYRAMRSRS